MRRAVVIVAVLMAPLVGCGAFGSSDVPDQTQFAPLADQAAQRRPFVRLYGNAIAPIELIAIHVSFVLKSAGSSDLQHWELQPDENGPYGHVRLTDMVDTADPEFFTRAFIISEVFDDQAQSIIDFIQSQSPTYPCRNVYEVLGPNSNTYIEWILQQTGWNVTLSPRAIGKDTPANCS